MSGLYDYRWQQARLRFLAEHSTCELCAAQDPPRLKPATVVDHRIPHRDDMELFWDVENWTAMCKPCHDRHKQKAEKSGHLPGCDQSGVPLDPLHQWHRGGKGG